MGEITFVALTSDTLSPLELRRMADVTVRRRLLAVPGISQVIAIGGDARQVQVEIDPVRMAERRVGLEAVIEATARASRAAAAGFHVEGETEYLVRGEGRARGPEDIARALVAESGGVPVRIGDVATVTLGPAPRRGTASFKGRPAVVLSVQKQLDANTLELTGRVDEALAELSQTLGSAVRLESETFRQANFISAAMHNVSVALRDGAILVVLVLFLFLGDLRSTLISALAIPLSLGGGVLAITAVGGTLNTMTLGGLTIAIGALVDDAIIDVENVFRRLRLESAKPTAERRTALTVVFEASREVRRAILFATLILILVLLPLFALPGVEGRLLRPLGLAYIAALAASLLVAMTVTPALCLVLLRGTRERREPWLLRSLRRLYEPTLDHALAHPRTVMGLALLLLLASTALLPGLGRSFLPPFNEGSLTVGATAPAGISLESSDALGLAVEEVLLAQPEVVSTTRRTGRAERDEHLQGVNRSEIEVVLRDGRPKDELLAELRAEVASIPGLSVEFGQPISHRIDHMISGSRTSLAVKIFGPDREVLRRLAASLTEVLGGVEGIVDLSNEEQASVPQLVVGFDREALAYHGLDAATLSTALEAAFQGTPVGEIAQSQSSIPVVVRYPPRFTAERHALGALPLLLPGGELLRLDTVADPRDDLGPSLVRREDGERLTMVTANVAGADLAGTIEAAREAVAEAVKLPAGYRVVYAGQFEEAVRSGRNLYALIAFILVAMSGLLYLAFRDLRAALIVLVNLPLALIGGLVAVRLGTGVLSVATLVGFVTLFGIAARNGVLLVTHYQNLLRDEDLDLAEAVRRGSMERLAPILMTALTAGLALIPLILAREASGNEIQSPMAEVILGGLLTSTLLNLVVVPVLFHRWGRGPGNKVPGT
jgi:CzcA family heavy metal efflux pump